MTMKVDKYFHRHLSAPAISTDNSQVGVAISVLHFNIFSNSSFLGKSFPFLFLFFVLSILWYFPFHVDTYYEGFTEEWGFIDNLSAGST